MYWIEHKAPQSVNRILVGPYKWLWNAAFRALSALENNEDPILKNRVQGPWGLPKGGGAADGRGSALLRFDCGKGDGIDDVGHQSAA